MLRPEDDQKFVAAYLMDCNKKIEIEGHQIDRLSLIRLLESYHGNLRQKMTNGIKIYGADKAQSFVMVCPNEKFFLEAVKDIWNNPEKYWEIDEDEMESDGGWDCFLKYLWIDNYKGCKDMRFADCATRDEEVPA